MNHPLSSHSMAFASIVLAVALTAPSTARSADRASAAGMTADPAARRLNPTADDIIGQNVRSTTGQDLGEVHDLVVDPNGRIVYALISSGGILGVGEILRAVPYAAFTSMATGPGKALAVDLGGADWTKAPIARTDRLEALNADQQGNDIYRYFGHEWPSGGEAMATAGDHGPHLLLVSKVDGQAVTHNGQRLGEIEDVLVQGDHVSALLAPAEGVAAPGRHYAIPLSQLSWASPADTTAQASFGAAELAQAPALPADGVPSNSKQLYVVNEPAGGRSRTPAPIVDGSAATVSAGGSTDVVAVRRALHQDPAVASAMQHVQVDRRGNELVLTGQVATRALKDEIGTKAARAAHGWTVSNQLTVAEGAAE